MSINPESGPSVPFQFTSSSLEKFPPEVGGLIGAYLVPVANNQENQLGPLNAIKEAVSSYLSGYTTVQLLPNEKRNAITKSIDIVASYCSQATQGVDPDTSFLSRVKKIRGIHQLSEQTCNDPKVVKQYANDCLEEQEADSLLKIEPLRAESLENRIAECVDAWGATQEEDIIPFQEKFERGDSIFHPSLNQNEFVEDNPEFIAFQLAIESACSAGEVNKLEFLLSQPCFEKYSMADSSAWTIYCNERSYRRRDSSREFASQALNQKRWSDGADQVFLEAARACCETSQDGRELIQGKANCLKLLIKKDAERPRPVIRP